MRQVFALFGSLGITGVREVRKKLTDTEKTAKLVEKQIVRLGKSVERLGVSFTKSVTVPIIAFTAAAYKGVEAASDLAETMTKVDAVFGDSSDAIKEWSNSSAERFGQSKQQALDAASTFGIFGKAAGLSGGELSKFSTKFAELGSDLASFYNTKPEEAITAIGAALRGENEPIRRFGVLLDDATLRTQALKMGIIDNIKTALTPQNKMLAASELIMKKTAVAQGDFVRTSGGLANQTRILQAQVKDLTAEFGKAFLPIALSLVKVLREGILPVIQKLVNWWNELGKPVRETIIAFTLAAAAFGPILILVGKFIAAAKILVPLYNALVLGQTALNGAMALNPIGLVVAGILALITAGVLLVRNWDAVSAFFVDMWETMKYGALQAIDYIIGLYAKMYLKAVEAFGIIAKHIPGLNKAYESAVEGLRNLTRKQEESIAARKLERAETLLQKRATEELNATVKEAEKVVTDYNLAELDITSAKEEDTSATEDLAKAEQDLLVDRLAFEDQWADKFRGAALSRLDTLEWERQEALNIAKEKGANVTDIELYYSIQRQKLAKEEADATIAEADRVAKERKQFASDTKDTIVNGIQTVFSVFSQANDNEIQRVENKAALEKEAILNSVMGEEEKAAAIANIESAADVKTRELRKKAARQEKASAIFSIILSTAMAVMTAVAQLGPIVGGIAAVAMGILGAAQIAVVASKPLPMAKGGLVKGGRGGIQAEIGEGTEDELVFPMKTGAAALADVFIDKLRNTTAPAFNASRPAGEQFSPASRQGPEVHIHAGTIVADRFSVSEFAKRIKLEIGLDDQRIGVA